MLAALRELPDRVVRAARRQPRRRRAAPTIAALIDASYWIVVDEIPRGELLLGLSMWNEEVERGRLTHERFERPASGAVNVGWVRGRPGSASMQARDAHEDKP